MAIPQCHPLAGQPAGVPSLAGQSAGVPSLAGQTAGVQSLAQANPPEYQSRPSTTKADLQTREPTVTPTRIVHLDTDTPIAIVEFRNAIKKQQSTTHQVPSHA